MAKIKLSSPVSDVRGALGQDVYSNWKGISYIRRKALTISNPQSAAQTEVRNALTMYSRLWLSTLTDAQRAAWEEYAKILGSAKKSETMVGYKSLMPDLGKTLSGKNAYISANTLLDRVGLTNVTDAPLGINVVSPPTGFTATWNPVPPGTMELAWVDPVDMGLEDLILVWLEYVGICHKQLRIWKAKAVLSADITNGRGANGELVDFGIGLYRFQLATLNTNGMRSVGSQLIEVNVAS